MLTNHYELERIARDVHNERLREADNERLVLAIGDAAKTRRRDGQKRVSTSKRLLANPIASWVLQIVRS